ncbi:MAG: isoleucine--tRNA ligase, partial [Christensenellaceae bacterium]|jgi:isoleucyl-tRNA synthetase|nr:isoleucine--tRNA ligase [Christensenellaceae bacterium]
MRGHSVPRGWGWVCHGLPIEKMVEYLLGVKDKTEIETTVGVDKFNEACYELVSKNNENWKEYIYNMARWVDYDGSYKTMNLDYMESVLWAFKTAYEKGLIYQDYRVTPYCHRCETPLSISETREDDATHPKNDLYCLVKMATKEVIDGKKVYFLAWTTTPWTLPSNMALAVNPELDYCYIEKNEEVFIVGAECIKNFEKLLGNAQIIKTIKGKKLEGRNYTPVFNYFANKLKDGAFRVVRADFVTATDGVGIVHMAPAFGEDDYWTAKSNNIPLVCPVDEKGNYTAEVTDFAGRNVLEANKDVLAKLKADGVVVESGSITHNYPHCWRCKKPLIYKAMKAWYFDVDKLKSELIKQNEDVNWIPEIVKHGRFGNWLEGARAWNISRNRYWSTPIPVWECECGERKVFGSIAEIEKASGVKLDNLHKQYMDKVICKCEKCGHEMHRIPEVLDCWFESACVPFAQMHYPFENREHFEKRCPGDFVAEYTGQIRCWFYYLHVLSVALFGKPAFKNCIVHGTVLDKEGKKMSKSSKNYTDPMKLMKEIGTDAYRMYLFRSSVMGIGDVVFDDAGLNEQLTSLILPLYSSVSFFTTYANLDGFAPTSVTEPKIQPQKDTLFNHKDTDTCNAGKYVATHQLDKWILAKLYATEKAVREKLDKYNPDGFAEPIIDFVSGLTNWYIRRSRRRFWGSEWTADKQNAYETLYYVLVTICKILAPACPIITEELYQILTGGSLGGGEMEPSYKRSLDGGGSVHLANWVIIPEKYKNEELLNETQIVQSVIYLARGIRTKNNIKNRQPLNKLTVATNDDKKAKIIKNAADIICEELNVKSLYVITDTGEIATTIIKPNFAYINANYKEFAGNIIGAIKANNFEIKNDEVFIGDNKYNSGVLLIEYIAKEGETVASANGLVISLDITITDALKKEGYARELVRIVQDKRKENNLEIADHILIEFDTNMPPEWKQYVLTETLGSEKPVAKPFAVCEVETDNGKITAKIGVAAK